MRAVVKDIVRTPNRSSGEMYAVDSSLKPINPAYRGRSGEDLEAGVANNFAAGIMSFVG
jgi:hypothetical protein